MTRIQPPCHPSQTSLRKMSPAAPSRRTNPAEKAATKAMRAEVRALLKLKRTPFEDKLMKLFTRDELVSLYRRSVGLQKDVPNDAVARQTKQWSKRTLAGKIHGLVKARSFGMLDGIVVAVAAIMVWVGAMWRFRRGDGRTGDAIPINGRAATDEGAYYQSMRPYLDGGVTGVALAPPSERGTALGGAMRRRRPMQAIATLAEEYRGMDTEICMYGSIGSVAETQPQATQPQATQRLLIATLCAVIAGGGMAGIAHGINVHARTGFRNRFAKHLRTLRAKRPSAASRRLTRFVKRFFGKK